MIGRESLAPLREPRFRYFLAARFASLLGNAIAPIALAFAVLDLTDSASALGTVLAARSIPMILLMLYGGVIADRLPRHVVLVVSHVVCFATQGLAAGLLLTGHAEVWQLAGIEVVNGAAAAFTMPALFGLLPHLVSREHLQQANALSGTIRTITMIGGASLGGVIVGFAGSGWGLAFDAVTFGVAAVLISRLKVGGIPPAERTSTLHDLRVGWREFVSRRWVWVVVVSFTVLNMIIAGAWNTLGPVVADDTFGRAAWGTILAFNAVGFLLGTMLMLRFRPRHPIRIAMLAMALEVPLIALLGWYPNAIVLCASALVAGTGVSIFAVIWETSMQQRIPHDKLSRVISYDMLGSFIGPLSAAFGIRDVIVGAAGVYLVVILIAVADRSVWSLRSIEAPVEKTRETAA
jgi:MFS family permease